MSVEGQVVSAAIVAGGTAASASSLVDTGNPAVVGVITGLVMIVILGFVTRIAARNS